MILGSIVIVERLIMKYQSTKAREMQQQMMDQMTREERRRLAKQYPQLFEGTGDNLIPKIHRMAWFLFYMYTDTLRPTQLDQIDYFISNHDRRVSAFSISSQKSRNSTKVIVTVLCSSFPSRLWFSWTFMYILLVCSPDLVCLSEMADHSSRPLSAPSILLLRGSST